MEGPQDNEDSKRVDYSGKGMPRGTLLWTGGHTNLHSRDYVCGHCGKDVSSSVGYTDEAGVGRIYICHRCGRPTFFMNDDQVPGPLPGDEIEHLPDEVEMLWEETRRCFSAGAWTAVVMCCRKMLMNVAVDQGAREGLQYSAYVDWIARNKLAPGNGDWVERIRDTGGEANHAIAAKEKDDALDLISFLGHLLRTVYEFPAKMRKKATNSD